MAYYVQIDFKLMNILCFASQVGYTAIGHSVPSRAGGLGVLALLSVQLYAGERQADPGYGARKHGVIRQIATRQACSVLSDRISGAVGAHDPRPHSVRDVVGDRRTQCHWVHIVPALDPHRQGTDEGGQ